MTKDEHGRRVRKLFEDYEALVARPNEPDPRWDGAPYERWRDPVLTRDHTPPFWRYDLDYAANPHLLERLGVNAVFNPGALEWEGKILLVARVEGYDRKSFFAVAESGSGVDGFRFWDYPLVLPETGNPDTNVYDMRLTRHEDGWVYGVFCTERRWPLAAPGDTTTAVAECGIARTRDMVHWQRLDDLKSAAPQQRNAVLHPAFVGRRYAFYTRPQDTFTEAGSGGGIGWGLADDIEHAVIAEERIVDPRAFHTVKEAKNGAGPAPLKTDRGWLHIAHGTRQTAAGLRYVLYAFLCDLDEPWRVTHRPGGYLIAPRFEERTGDVSNVVFSNGAVMRDDGRIFIYYASSDTRCHVATTTVEKMLDYVENTPPDAGRSHACAQQRSELIARNLDVMRRMRLR